MKTVARSYQYAFAGAIIFHAVLFFILLFHAVATNYRVPGKKSKSAPQIIQASAMTEHQLQHQMRDIRQQKMKTLLAKTRTVEAVQKTQLAKNQLLLEKRLARQEKKLKQMKLNNLAKVQQQLQHDQLAQAMKAEQDHLKLVETAQIKGIVDRYKGMILQKLRGYWRVPADIDRNMHCLYRVILAPNGVVLEAVLMKSSGNLALDHLAKMTIMRASPLPVPKNTAAFDNMRELQLIMTPGTKNFSWLG